MLSNRERVETLATDNETLRDQMRQTEKDTLDVVSFLKKQDVEKDTEVQRFFEFSKQQRISSSSNDCKKR